MLNRAVLTGRLTRDVDLRYTQSGTAVGTFTLAVDRTFKNQQGEREADFINCVIWRKSAENFANFVRKGSLVGIDGRIQTRNYENQQGTRVYVTEIVVENFALLQSRSDREGGNNNGAYPGMASAGAAPAATGNPFDNPFGGSQNNGGGSNNSNNTNNNAADPFANNGDSIDISDDDLPF